VLLGARNAPACTLAAAAAWRRRHHTQKTLSRLPALCVAGNIEVSFSLPYHCKYGQRLCIIGGSDFLGAWNVERAVPMEWSEGDVWTVDMNLPTE